MKQPREPCPICQRTIATYKGGSGRLRMNKHKDNTRACSGAKLWKPKSSNQVGEEVIELAQRLITAAPFIDIKAHALTLIEEEGVAPDIAWLALGGAREKLGDL